MEVFYVVLLVLVAGVVPSHGRTESEGTVFNKTQLRESMSNVTVSSSKVVPYHLSYLALQWPMSFCIALDTNFDRQCNQQPPPSFTVHGLWPQHPLGGSVDCRLINGPYRRLNYHNLLLGESDLNDLNLYWPDLIDGNNRNFWINEYNKHGSCTFNNYIWYFRRTVQLARRFDHLISRLTGNGIIVYDGPISHSVIRDAVHRVTKIWPTLNCVVVGNRSLLLEIRFCVGPGGLKNCDPYDVTNCVGSVVIPRPPRRP